MTQETTFASAGIATIGDVTKVRYGNDIIQRIKRLNKKVGIKTVNLIELPQPMTKLEALEYLSTHPDFQDADAAFAIQTKLIEKRQVAKKGEVKVAGGAVKAKQAAPVAA